MKIEYDKEEYIAIINLAGKIVETFERLVLQDMSNKSSIKEVISAKIKENIASGNYSKVDVFSEDTEDEQESILKFEEGKKKYHIQYVDRGRSAFEKMLAEWLINFNKEGQQPDRAQIIKDLTMEYNGRAIMHYMEWLKEQNKGLAWAVHDSALVDKKDILLVAGNIAQVASASGFYQLSSYLEYPEPIFQ